MSLLLLLACASSGPRQLLPVQLSLLLERQDGTPKSMVVELGRNLRDQLDLRYSSGWRLYDGRHIWEWKEGFWVESCEGNLSFYAGKGMLLGADRTTIWLSQPNQTLACDMKAWPEWSEYPSPRKNIRCTPDSSSFSLRLARPGPGEGFSVWLKEDAVHVRLPADKNPEGKIVSRDVARIVGVRWVERPRKVARATLERLFRGQAVLSATALVVEVDGDLQEWEGLPPLVVEKEWHLQDGGAHWSGAKDASFSLIAAMDGPRVCVAGRLRDDDRQPTDRLLMSLGAQKWTLPLGDLSEASHASFVSPDMEVQLNRDWYGASFEACVQPNLPISRRYPFSFSWEDYDYQQPPTTLSTAPTEGPSTGALLREFTPGS